MPLDSNQGMERHHNPVMPSRQVPGYFSTIHILKASIGGAKSSIWTHPLGFGSFRERIAGIARWLIQTVGISNEQGAVVPVWLATAEEPSRPELRGLYWDRLEWKWIPAWCLEKSRQERLWEKWCMDAGANIQ